MSEIESLNLDLLKHYLDDSAPRYLDLEVERAALSILQVTTVEACLARSVVCPGVETAFTHIENMHTNHCDAQDVYDKIVELGFDPASFSSAELEAALGSGALDAPEDLEMKPNALYGMPPHSGYTDDPICAANGNFVHIDTDLETPGFGHVTNIVRTYNSMAAAARNRQGSFGWGWSGLIDMRLNLTHVSSAPEEPRTTGTVEAVLADGGSVYFTADDNGAFAPNDPRQLNLDRVEGGWVLRKGRDEAWTFDEAGVLTGGHHQLSTWIVTRTSTNETTGSLRIKEVNSERSVQYLLRDGLVQTATASDGRKLTYEYEDGHCVRAVRPIGDVTYEIANNLIETIRDADGVLLCTNDYDERGRTMGQLSPHGRHTSYEYLPNGVTRVSDPEHGRTNVLIHDRQGNLTAMFDGLGASMTQKWDHRNRAIEVVDRAGNRTEFVYADGPEDLLLERIDPDGQREVREYDETGRVARQVDRSGAVRTWLYDGDSLLPRATIEPNGGEIHIRYNDLGLPTSYTDPDGIRTDWMWDRDGQPVAVTNAVGERTVHVYDATGQLVRTVDPMGRTETFVRDVAGRVVTHTNFEGRTEHITFTPAGRAVCGDVDGPGSWSATFGNHGLMDSVTDALGATVRFSYDDVGNMVEATAPDGLTHRLEYDELCQLTAAVGPTGLRATQTFDKAGRVVAFTDVEGGTLRRTIDAMGRTVSATDPLGLQTEWVWHPNGELAQHTLPTGDTFSFEIDAMGRVTAEIAPDGSRTTNRWSLGGRLLETTTPSGRTSTWTYDPAGRLRTHTDADGQQTHFELRGDDKVAHIIAPDTVTTLRYDANGEAVESYTSASGITPDFQSIDGDAYGHQIAMPERTAAGIELDARGLVDRFTDPAGVLTQFTRDVRGRLIGAQTGEHSQHLQWGDTGMMESMTDPLGQVKTWTHSPGGHLTGVDWGEGLGRMLHRDAGGRVTSITTPNGAPLAAFTFNALGQVTSATNEHGTVSARVDHHGLVHATTGLNNDEITYERDADGMLMRRTHSNGTSVSWERSTAGRVVGLVDSEIGAVALPTPAPPIVDAGGRVVSDHLGRRFSYDTAGRIESSLDLEGVERSFTWNDLGLLATDTTPERGQRTFHWDAASQLASTMTDRGHKVTFDYDIAGRRISETHSDGTSTRFEWNELDQLQKIHRTDATGRTVTREIAWSALNRPERVDELAIGWDDAVTNKPVQIGDRRWLRSGRWMREATAVGQWHDGTTDDPWGDGGPIGITLGYRGELSVDGLIIMGARVYDPATRTFLSRDPLPALIGVNAFAGVYVYAWNDPVNFVDPTGLRPLSVEEFDEHLANRERSRFGSAWEAVKADPLGAIVLVAVVAVGVALLIPPATALGAATLGVAAGMLIGAGATAAMGIHNKQFSPSGSAINGIVGGATGVFGPMSWGAQVAGGAAVAATGNVYSQGLDSKTGLTGLWRDGTFYEEGWSQFKPGEFAAATIGGGLVPPGLGPGVGNRIAAVGMGMVSGGVSDGISQWAQDPGPWHDWPDLNWTSIGVSTAGGGLGEGVGGRTAGGHTDFGPNRTHFSNVRAQWATDAAIKASADADQALLNARLRFMDARDAVDSAVPNSAAHTAALKDRQAAFSEFTGAETASTQARSAADAAVANEVAVSQRVVRDGEAGLASRRDHLDSLSEEARGPLEEGFNTYEQVVEGWRETANAAPVRAEPPSSPQPPPPAPTSPDLPDTGPGAGPDLPEGQPITEADAPQHIDAPREMDAPRDTTSSGDAGSSRDAGPPAVTDDRAGYGHNGEIIQVNP